MPSAGAFQRFPESSGPANLISAFTRSLLWVLLSVSCIFSFHFPDTAAFKDQCKEVLKENDLPVVFTKCRGKKDLSIELAWQGREITEVRYRKKSYFKQKEFSELAGIYGEGGAWYETPVSGQEKQTLEKIYPGIEQQWVLKNYGGETGWIGSGLFEDFFFLVFKRGLPAQQLQLAEDFSFKPAIMNLLSQSGNWIPVPCLEAAEKKTCYKSIITPGMHLSTETRNNKLSVSILLKENNPISDIQSSLKSRKPEDFREYASDLTGLSATETQNFLAKVSFELSSLLQSPVWELEGLQKNRMKESDYLEIFRTRGTDWPSIPIFKYKGRKVTMEAFLFFNGHYRLDIQEL